MIDIFGFLLDDIHILPIMERAYLPVTHEY